MTYDHNTTFLTNKSVGGTREDKCNSPLKPPPLQNATVPNAEALSQPIAQLCVRANVEFIQFDTDLSSTLEKYLPIIQSYSDINAKYPFVDGIVREVLGKSYE